MVVMEGEEEGRKEGRDGGREEERRKGEKGSKGVVGPEEI